jgi:hypothetical protein
MPRTAITPQAATSAGLAITFEPANVLGNSFAAARGRALHVKNGSGSSINVTLPTPAVADGDLSIDSRIVAVAAGAHTVIGLGASSSAGIYAQPVTGVVHVDYSAVTTVTVAVIDQP